MREILARMGAQATQRAHLGERFDRPPIAQGCFSSPGGLDVSYARFDEPTPSASTSRCGRSALAFASALRELRFDGLRQVRENRPGRTGSAGLI
jgi:hypothetical protein